MKNILVVLLLFAVVLPVSAQRYFTAAGVRLGTDWGLTVEQRLAKRWTTQVLLNYSNENDLTLFTILGERHQPLIGKRINVFMGAGAHFGSFDGRKRETYPDGPKGITLIGGLEATFGRLNVSFDFKPAINLVDTERTIYPQSGLSVRYVIAKNGVYKDLTKSKKQRQKDREKARRKEERGEPRWKFWKD